MSLRIAHGTLFLALLGTAAYGADVYRSTAPDGTVIYTDRPQGADSEYVTTTSPTTARPAANTAAARAPGATPAALPQAPGNPTLPEGPSSDELRGQRQKNCEIARERLDRYNLSRRLFRTNAAGEREYLDDAAVADARAKAVADVQDWCD
ncbi:MAG TPA: DUF4124 domain-containing protein [Gammaproteobacteria bacterium]|nr:DUF4124 domain-containing protein [Gammaproteobacteria bacterium]